MEEITCKQVATLTGGKWDKVIDKNRRVYSAEAISPTLTTCGGGNQEIKIMIEPKIIQRSHGYNQGREVETTYPSITISSWQENNLLKEPIIYDDYNGRIKADQSAIGTLTTNCGSDAERNGVKIIEPSERFFKQAFETATENECTNGDIIDAYNGKVNKDGVSPTVTTRPEGFKTAILPIQNYRIRKLTPKECWRLMGFDDEDFYKAAYGREIPIPLVKRLEKRDLKRNEWKELWRHLRRQEVSNSQLYKQAGNSIVVNVLEAIFKEML